MDGIIPIIKPPGITSHDVIGIARRILREKRIGHSGTLDPLAMGVLPIYIGKATRLIEYAGGMKTYVAEAQFGIMTDTEDISGTVLEKKNISLIPNFEKNVLQEVCRKFIGHIQQRPSNYSAIKINGQRAYELSRRGIEFTLPSKEIFIAECELVAYAFPHFTIKVHCSAGTYIRALIRDIMSELGTIGTMTALTRTSVDSFDINNAFTLEEVAENHQGCLYEVDHALQHMPKLELDAIAAKCLTQGQKLSKQMYANLDNGLYRLYMQNIFLGIAEVDSCCIKAQKIIFSLEN